MCGDNLPVSLKKLKLDTPQDTKSENGAAQEGGSNSDKPPRQVEVRVIRKESKNSFVAKGKHCKKKKMEDGTARRLCAKGANGHGKVKTDVITRCTCDRHTFPCCETYIAEGEAPTGEDIGADGETGPPSSEDESIRVENEDELDGGTILAGSFLGTYFPQFVSDYIPIPLALKEEEEGDDGEKIPVYNIW